MRKLVNCLMAFLLVSVGALLLTTRAAAITPQGVSNAFQPDWSDLEEAYADAYGWDFDKVLSESWEDDISGDDRDYTRKTGYQTKFYKDNILTTKQYLGLTTSEFSGGNGMGIVAVAMGELGLEDSVEVPSGSNNVKYNTWYYGHEVSGENYPWCAAFVAWCADQCGYLESGLFMRTASSTAQYNHLTGDMGFESYRVTDTTPMGGDAYTPVPGDIMFFSETGSTTMCHIGIIVDVEEDGWYTVEGNTTGGGQIPGGGVAQNHYTKSNISRISTARHGYVVHVQYPSDSATAYNFLTEIMGLNNAAACGVLANMSAESGIIADRNEIGGGGGYGLCQWTGTRKTRLEKWCDDNDCDPTSMDGQLWFLQYELEEYYPDVLEALESTPNTAQGAYDAAHMFCMDFERPKDKASEAVKRGNSAKNDFWPMYSSGAAKSGGDSDD